MENKLFARYRSSHQSLFFNRAAGLRPANLLKKRLWHVFSFEFCEISRNTFFTEHLWWLLLEIIYENCTNCDNYILRYQIILKTYLSNKWYPMTCSYLNFSIVLTAADRLENSSKTIFILTVTFPKNIPRTLASQVWRYCLFEIHAKSLFFSLHKIKISEQHRFIF